MLHFVILRVCIFNNSTIIPLILWLPPGLDWDKKSAMAFWLRPAHYFMIINTTDLYTESSLVLLTAVLHTHSFLSLSSSLSSSATWRACFFSSEGGSQESLQTVCWKQPIQLHELLEPCPVVWFVWLRCCPECVVMPW